MRACVAIVGGGIAGVTAAWQLHRLGREFRLYEASGRLGGTVETVRRDGFVVEMGPDGWVSEKPWARELAEELGLGGEVIGSNDTGRVTYIVQQGRLVAMPDGMRMMVPTDLLALEGSALFSAEARETYAREPARAAELKAASPGTDESVAAFVERHFGGEVLEKLAGPLLSGVFGGDVAKLSVRAVMPVFVQMEREHGSLIAGLRARQRQVQGTIFTTLTSGTQTLIDRMGAELPEGSLHLNCPVASVVREGGGWRVGTPAAVREGELCDELVIATPAHETCRLLGQAVPQAERLLRMEASSAVVAALAFDTQFELPRGFGFLAPEGQGSELLAGTFADQKYGGRVPKGCRLLRGFFGGAAAETVGRLRDEEVAARSLRDLRALLGPLPEPMFTVVRRWPKSLPQYGVGHLERMAELDVLARQEPGLRLIGNAYRGVGLPDLVRDARAAARAISES